jgi:hypothetical protein
MSKPFIRYLIPFLNEEPSGPYHLQKAPSLDAITMVKFLNFGKNILKP